MLLLLPSANAQDVSIRDSLASSTTATTVYGGTFTGTGWRVDDSSSRLYWDLGTQVQTATVSFTTDDITLSNLTGDNNEFIQMFDSGDKWSCTHAVTMRAYGDITGTSWGDVKLKTWDNASGLYSEARGGVQDWDGGPHTWTITWTATTATLARDGVEIVNMDVTGQDLSVGTVWLPLNTWDYGYSHPIGSIYSDLSFDGWVSGGGDDGGDDTGTVTPEDGGRPPVQDAGVIASYGDTVYDAETDLPVDGSGEHSYLLFDLSDLSGTVTSATLNLHAQSDSHADGDGGGLYEVEDTTWTEDSLTWNNRPSLGTQIDSFSAVGASDTVSFDVTAYVSAGGLSAFALANGGSNTAHFWSKEGSSPPSLVVQATGDDGGGGGADSGGEGGAGGGGGGADGEHPGRDGGPGGTSDLGDVGGCACGSVDGSRGLAWALVVGLGLAGRRRRRPWPSAVSDPRSGRRSVRLTKS
jgi:MYXO-CTERM domain-containing protein